jgi:hypothetical protein
MLKVRWLVVLLLPMGLTLADEQPRPFKIRVVDEQTGRGVPLVELRTVNNLCYYTDSNGLVAFAEPGLLDQHVFFHVQSHGYEFPKDGFGFRGKALAVTSGGSTVLPHQSARVSPRKFSRADGHLPVTGQGRTRSRRRRRPELSDGQ